MIAVVSTVLVLGCGWVIERAASAGVRAEQRRRR